MNPPKRTRAAARPSTPQRRGSVPSGSHPRSRSGSGLSALRWVAMGITVPVLSFLATVYFPAISLAVRGDGAKLTHHRPRPAADVVPPATTPPSPADDPGALTAASLPAGSSSVANPAVPLQVVVYRGGPIPFTAVVGGTAGTHRSALRLGVADFVKATGATAGLNGTFFANASLTGTDNLLIGPSVCKGEDKLVISPFDDKPQLTGRPMVLFSPTRTTIVPYQLGRTDTKEALLADLPDMTDAFVGGVWLVHRGVAATQPVIDSYNVHDCMDPRRRAFFAVMPDGRPLLGATTDVATSRQLADALHRYGVEEAVLLDSGFSTSLVFQDKILVTGHTSPGIPSRPVPHALVLYGSPAAGSVQLAESLRPSIATRAQEAAATVPLTFHRRHRRRFLS